MLPTPLHVVSELRLRARIFRCAHFFDLSDDFNASTYLELHLLALALRLHLLTVAKPLHVEVGEAYT